MIHSYGRRTIRERVVREAEARTETRDAILWQVLPDQRKARIKIQGSNTLVVARYPENWEQTPAWLKPGNAVKVLHTAGNRNSVEIIGHGLAVPTPVDDVDFTPIVAAGPDTVISGCQVRALVDEPAMQVWIETGTYRINNTQYTLGEMVMSETNVTTMESGVPMGATVTVINVNAAHSTLFRIDIFSVGVDGVVEYTPGTAAVTPQQPATPLNKVLLGWVLLPPGTTAITTQLINRLYIEPFVSQIGVTPSTIELTWEPGYIDITVQVLDQYGVGITSQRWGIRGEVETGSGSFDNERVTVKTKYVATNGSTVVFRYHRKEDYRDFPSVTEDSPVFIYFSLVQDPDIQMIAPMILLNELGGMIT